MTKAEAIEKAKEAIVRAEVAQENDLRYSELSIADRWITLAIHAFSAEDRSLVDA